MYYAMVFHVDPLTYMSNVRSVRPKGYATIDQAVKAIQRTGLQGYVKQANIRKPVWNNVV